MKVYELITVLLDAPAGADVYGSCKGKMFQIESVDRRSEAEEEGNTVFLDLQEEEP